MIKINCLNATINIGFLIISLLGNCQDLKNSQRFENMIIEYEKLDKLQSVEDSVVLFVGSSTIKRWKNINDFFLDYNILNRGFGGSEFTDLLYYTDRIVIPYNPHRIFVYEGDNDINRNKKPRRVFKQAKTFRKIIFKKLPNAEVIFISVKPSIARWHLREKYKTFNYLIKGYTSVTENTEYANIWDIFIDENNKVMKDVFVKDGLHLNAKGYEVLAKALEPFIKR